MKLTRDKLRLATEAVKKLPPKARYNKLVADIEAIEKANNNAYLVDEAVSFENASFKLSDLPHGMDDEQYIEMWYIVGSEAGGRAAELGLDLNQLLGYIVY